MSEQSENTDIKSKGGGHGLIWGVTIIAALSIIGLCAFIALGKKGENTSADHQSVELTKPYQEPVAEPPAEPIVDITEPTPRAEPEIELIEEQEPAVEAPKGPPKLLLDNLAGLIELDVPFLEVRNKMPLEHTCFRSNVSPEIKWGNAPSQTKSYVVFLEKRESADKEPFLYWVLFNIPASQTSLTKALPASPELPNGVKHANSDHNNTGYIGPCDSKGQRTYALRIFALDKELELNAGAHKHDLIRAMNGHIIDAAEREFVHYYRL